MPFYQLDPHQTSQSGTGLGLSISHSLAEQMNSQIEVTSIVGEGSIFWFDLAFTIIEGSWDITIGNHGELDIVSYQGQPKQILVVDDLDDNREILVNLLTSLGFEIIEASSGSEAIDLTQEQQPDLVLLDLIMPDMDGWEVTQHLRQKSQFDRLPMIIISASTFNKNEFNSYAAGASEFSPKPLNFRQLLQFIEQYLNLVWVAADGSQRSLLNQPATSIEDVASPPLLVPNLEILKSLQALILQGDIRGIINYIESLKDRPDWIPFLEQITQLAQSCQLKKLKQFIQQYVG